MKISRILPVVLLLLVFFSQPSYSQTKPNSVYFELVGNGCLYSINYDRLFTENLSGRIGLMYLSKLDLSFLTIDDIVIVPITLNYLIGNGSNKFEIGAGIDYLSFSGGSIFGLHANVSESKVFGTATIGYRYQQADGGFLFRIGFTPIFGENGLQPLAGLSFGFSF
jgi:hypothetical protein